MNYKGIQLPLTSYDSNTGNYFKKLYTVVDVTFDPCIVTFDNGAKVPWNHTKEEFDLYIETIKFPSVKEYLNELLKDKLIFMSKQWWRFEKLDNAMIPNVYSARYDKYSDNQLIINGVEQWKKMKYQLAEYAYRKDSSGNYVYSCIIEIDLLNFYDNINKKLLIEKIS